MKYLRKVSLEDTALEHWTEESLKWRNFNADLRLLKLNLIWQETFNFETWNEGSTVL